MILVCSPFNESEVFLAILTINSTDNIKCHPLQAKCLLEFLYIQIRQNTTVTKILLFVSARDRLLHIYNGYTCCRILTIFHVLHLQIRYKKAHNNKKFESK